MTQPGDRATVSRVGDSIHSAGRVGEVARYFLRLGFTAFGGPAAHISMMEAELVARRGWLDRTHFLDLISAINFIPGPNSTELAIHLGYLRAGWRGLFAAGACFILPAMLIILPIAWMYERWHTLPQMQGMMHAIAPVVIAIIAAALLRLGKTALTDRFTIGVTILAIIAEVSCRRFHWMLGDVTILATAALLGIGWERRFAPAQSTAPKSLTFFPAKWLIVSLASVSTVGIGAMGWMTLQFLQIGATLFGSGYVLVTYLQTAFVDHHHLLTPIQLADAVAVGQVTPGPLLSTATFIGFLLGYEGSGGGLWRGCLWGLVATASIFAPSFVFIALLGPVLPRLRRSRRARAALRAVNAAVVALIAVTCVQLAVTVVGVTPVWPSAILFAVSLALILRKNINPTYLIAVAAMLGALLGR